MAIYSQYSQKPPSKVRNALASLKGKRCVITFHSLADLDACAGALALSNHIGKNAIVAMQDRINSACKRVLGADAKKIVLFSDAIKKFPDAKIILLDCNDISLLPSLEGKNAELLIDHHALGTDSARAKSMWINPQASSVCEMISLLIKKPDREQAKWLIYGIVSDSNHLLHANAGTFSALSKLNECTDEEFENIVESMHMPQPAQSRIAILEGVKNSSILKRGEIICASTTATSCESHVADTLIRSGADCAFAGSFSKEWVGISARMKKKYIANVDLPQIMAEVGAFLGGNGGGHPTAAGATGTNPQKLEDALSLAQELFFEQVQKKTKIRI
ncbi:MAG: DHHA1 domain-containing protein [Candidatus Micrarchaeia archaeon]